MNYTDLIGDYAIAYQDVLIHGGQLYPGNGKESASVVVRGNDCFTYWNAHSKRYWEVQELCKFFNLEPQGKTGGRIARWLIDEILQLPYKTTFWNKQYRAIAKSGHHWHYNHVQPWKPFFGIEVDLKSAYFSSLLQGKSLLYQPGSGYLKDNNALETLGELIPNLPKWFRLQLLGVLASWRFQFLAKDKKNADNKELIWKQYHVINYNGAFNAVHRAIIRNYKIMEKIHSIGGEYIRRMHTDSFFLDCDCPRQIEDKIWSFIDEKKVKYDVKGAGHSFFFDLNTGFVGNRIVGAKIDVIDQMKSNNIKMKNNPINSKLLDRFGEVIANSSFNINIKEVAQDLPELEEKELQLFNTSPY